MEKLTCFKAYDIRGKLGEELNEDIAWRIGRAYGEYLKPQTIVLGGDVRLTSESLKLALAKGLQDAGVDVLDIGLSGTEEIYFATFHLGVDGGIEVTASHNPALYNGIKLFTKGGRDAVESITSEIADEANAITADELHPIPYQKAVDAGLIEEMNPQNEYLDSIIRAVNMDAIRSRNLRIILDPMYGVSRTCLQTILLTARCDVDVIHERHDTLFGGRLPAPNMETLGALKAAVRTLAVVAAAMQVGDHVIQQQQE